MSKKELLELAKEYIKTYKNFMKANENSDTIEYVEMQSAGLKFADSFCGREITYKQLFEKAKELKEKNETK